MATIINTRGSGESAGSGAGIIVAVIVALLLIAVFFVYALPALRQGNAAPASNGINVDVKLPEGGNNGGNTGGGSTGY